MTSNNDWPTGGESDARTTSASSGHRRTLRRGLWVGIAAVALVAAVWAGVARYRGARVATPAPAATKTAMGGMQGMQGMSGGDTATSGAAVTFTANQVRQFGVTFGAVAVRRLDNRVRTVGTVTFDERKLTQITPKFGGYVEHLFVNTTGQAVRQGEPLATIYSPEILAAEEDLLVAGRLARAAGGDTVPGVPGTGFDLLAAARQRLSLWDISDAQIDSVLKTGTVQRALTLYAPAPGVVIAKNIVQGQAIQPGMALYQIADLSTVWIDVAIRQGDAALVRPGSAATIDLTSFPGRPFTGRVGYVYPTIDSVARTIHARVQVPNSSGLLKPGMYATVSLATPSRRALTVPTTAIVNTGERELVFLDLGDGRFVPHDVETGRTAGDYTEVLSGLEPGQRVVTSAQFLLDSESNLAEVMKSMMAQMNMSDVGRAQSMPGMDMSGHGASQMNAKGAPMKGMKGMTPPSSTSVPRR
ncbi:MAG TPA: efflux RND transporter periplasmic adaptor subunit [Gemmatimonadaceae bacterium]|nr:efflux RND transporter periplasmic adaptor subunit [Gemmatimonadaceae bacterium]